MQELMDVRLKDEIIHVNNDWMESSVSLEFSTVFLFSKI